VPTARYRNVVLGGIDTWWGRGANTTGERRERRDETRARVLERMETMRILGPDRNLLYRHLDTWKAADTVLRARWGGAESFGWSNLSGAVRLKSRQGRPIWLVWVDSVVYLAGGRQGRGRGMLGEHCE
jgi:hypothetical protein